MFTEQQRNFIQQFVLTNKDKYPYYLAYTNTNIEQYGGNNANTIQFYIILSDKPITAINKYRYTFSGSVKYYGIRGSNANFNYNADRIAEYNSITEINIDSYEFVYTNANFNAVALQPDITITNSVEQSHFDGFVLFLGVVLIAVITFKLLRGGSNVRHFR